MVRVVKFVQRRALEVFRSVLDFVLPPICLGCGQEIDAGLVCYQCLNKINNSGLGVCVKCGFPLKFNEKCPHCANNLLLPRTRALGLYSEPLSNLIHSLKYDGKQSLAKIFASALVGLLNSDPILKKADFLVPIPLHPARQRERGYNQAFLIAFEIFRLCGIPVVQGLKRIRNTKSQSFLDKKERILNVQNAFAIKETKLMINKRVIIVDDVITSGATIYSAGQCLLNAGAKEVYGLVVARA